MDSLLSRAELSAAERSLRSRLAQLTSSERFLHGSLSERIGKCGKPTCHCASGEGHPIWFLTFMSQGKRRVERIPKQWVDDVRRRVEAGRAFQDALREVLTANAELLVLWRKQQPPR